MGWAFASQANLSADWWTARKGAGDEAENIAKLFRFHACFRSQDHTRLRALEPCRPALCHSLVAETTTLSPESDTGEAVVAYLRTKYGNHRETRGSIRYP